MGKVIELKVEPQPEIKLSLQSEPILKLQTREVNEVAVTDYRKLVNKPTINGIELYDNYDEMDPTVPEWVKKETSQPEEMSIAEIYDVWNSVFN